MPRELMFVLCHCRLNLRAQWIRYYLGGQVCALDYQYLEDVRITKSLIVRTDYDLLMTFIESRFFESADHSI